MANASSLLFQTLFFTYERAPSQAKIASTSSKHYSIRNIRSGHLDLAPIITSKSKSPVNGLGAPILNAPAQGFAVCAHSFTNPGQKCSLSNSNIHPCLIHDPNH